MGNLVSIKHNLPKKLISEAAIKAAINKATQKGAEKIVKKLTHTVSTWENPPIFAAVKTANGWVVKFDARTSGGQHFIWVSGGVKAHRIDSKHGGMLAFNWNGIRNGFYKAKSHIGSLNPYKGMSSKRADQGTIHIAGAVEHPGIWPRDFVGLVMSEEKEYIMKDLVKVTSEMVSHSIHSPGMEREHDW